jgi:hypothetical protein
MSKRFDLRFTGWVIIFLKDISASAERPNAFCTAFVPPAVPPILNVLGHGFSPGHMENGNPSWSGPTRYASFSKSR